MTDALADRRPEPTLERLLADLVPPPRFARARLENYEPDPAHPSQAHAKEAVTAFADRLGRPRGRWRSLLRRKSEPARGIYLDGGFGVGKTHLLTALFHAAEGHRVYGTFVEYTDLVGALGFQRAVDLLGESVLVCIDEFELDDPGDTLLMTRLIRELSDRGVAVAATSNTLPEALGEGRFAAQDFLREIQSMAERFEVLRVDGEDYRRRHGVDTITVLPEPTVRRSAAAATSATLDDFEQLLRHLTAVHPSRYGALIDDVDAAHVTGLRTIGHHHDALRLVVLIDRLYDREVPMPVSAAPTVAEGASDGAPGAAPAAEAPGAADDRMGPAGSAPRGPTAVLEELYSPELLRSGYRKKYFRSLSRLASLAHDGAGLVAAEPTAAHPS